MDWASVFASSEGLDMANTIDVEEWEEEVDGRSIPSTAPLLASAGLLDRL